MQPRHLCTRTHARVNFFTHHIFSATYLPKPKARDPSHPSGTPEHGNLFRLNAGSMGPRMRMGMRMGKEGGYRVIRVCMTTEADEGDGYAKLMKAC